MRIRDLRVRAVRVPLDHPHRTGSDAHQQPTAASWLAKVSRPPWGPLDFQHALDVHASDYMMPEVMKMGGITGWLAATAGVRISTHLWPEVSAQLLYSRRPRIGSNTPIGGIPSSPSPCGWNAELASSKARREPESPWDEAALASFGA